MSFVSCRRTVNMVYKRVCRDCPIEGCGAKYLVRLANHLADVHKLDHTQRRNYLQEAKLQPKVKVIIYHNTENNPRKDSGECSTSEALPSIGQGEQRTVYHVSTPREPKALRSLQQAVLEKQQKLLNAVKGQNIYLLNGSLYINVRSTIHLNLLSQIARMNQIQEGSIKSVL